MGAATELNNIMHSSNAYYSEIEGTPYNPERAKELLAEAGYKEGELTLKLVTNNTATSQAACTIIQAHLDEIGVTVDLEVMENATLTTVMESGEGYNMAYSRWSGYAFGPDNGVRQMLHSDGSNNYCHMADAKMDKMLDDALAMEDHDARVAAYKEISEYSDELMGNYPILVEDYVFAAGAHVENLLQPNGPIMNFREIIGYEK